MTSHQQIIVSPLHLVILSGIVIFNGWLTIRDYFGTWANDDFVRFQYHAPTRDIAKWLDQNPDVVDVAIGTNPNELVLDPLALKLDLVREDVKDRWFNPETVWYGIPSVGMRSKLILSPMQAAGASVENMQRDKACAHVSKADGQFVFAVCNSDFGGNPNLRKPQTVFDKWLGFAHSDPHYYAHPGDSVTYSLDWPIMQPYFGLPLKIFLHLLDASGNVVASDDRFEVNLLTVQPGDYIRQFSTLNVPPDLQPGVYQIEIGVYNPNTGERLKREDGSDRLLLRPLEVIAP